MDNVVLDQAAGFSAILIVIEILSGVLWVFYTNRKNGAHSLKSAVPWLIWFAVSVILCFMLAWSITIATATGWDFLPLMIPLYFAGLWVRHSLFPSSNWHTTWWQWWKGKHS